MYVCLPCVCLVATEVREGMRFPETGVVNHHVATGNQSWVYQKSSQCSLTAKPSLQPMLLMFSPFFPEEIYLP